VQVCAVKKIILPPCALLLAFASADEAVAGKMRALFPNAASDQSGTLTAEEQARAVEYVKTTFGGQ